MIWAALNFVAGAACSVAMCGVAIVLSAKDTGPMEFDIFRSPSCNFDPID